MTILLLDGMSVAASDRRDILPRVFFKPITGGMTKINKRFKNEKDIWAFFIDNFF